MKGLSLSLLLQKTNFLNGQEREKEMGKYLNFEREFFLETLKKMKSFGYEIYVSENFKEDCFLNYAIILNEEKNFISVSFEVFGVKFSSLHKENKESGTGFILSNILRNKDISKELVDEFFKVKVPDWWNGSIPEFYKDFEEYLKNEHTKILQMNFKGTGKPSDISCLSWQYENLTDAENTAGEYFSNYTKF